jgi:phage shock protein PspC (stress-responsive transcriptional regulator)
MRMSESTLERVRRQVHLDRHNAWIAGVCAGIATVLRTDPAFLRVAMVVAALFMPRIAIGAYLVIWILLYQRDKDAMRHGRPEPRK